jgi:hypothetical protein
VVDQIEFVLGGPGSGVPQDVALPNIGGLSMMRNIVIWDEKCWSAVSRLEEHPTGESLQTVYWRTLIFDGLTWEEHSTEDRDQLSDASFAAWRTFIRVLVNSNDPGSIRSIKKSREIPRQFQARFGGKSHGRQPCIMREGYIDWVHDLAQPGDFIRVFQGCHVPFTLRKTFVSGEGNGNPDEPAKFILFGPCYIHGLGEELLLEPPQFIDTIELI